MIGKKFREMIPAHAEKEGIPEEDLRHIISCYYRHVARALEGLAHPRIEVLGLGRFIVKRPASLLKEFEDMEYEDGPYMKIVEQLRADIEKKEQKRIQSGKPKRVYVRIKREDTTGLGE